MEVKISSGCNVTMNDIHHNKVVYVNCNGNSQNNIQSDLSREERVANAIKQMLDEGVIVEKQQFAAIFQILREKNIYESLTQQAFVDFLEKQCKLSVNLIPERSLLGKVSFAGRFPEWQTSKSDPLKNAMMVEVARKFLNYSGY